MAVTIMFGSYILHSWAHPYLIRDNVPQTFFDIVNSNVLSHTEVGIGDLDDAAYPRHRLPHRLPAFTPVRAFL